MMTSTVHNPLDVGRRRTFAGLMELYENNYIYMRRLLPEPDRNSDRVVSRVAGTPDLHLAVLERHPYTTSVLLTYCFPRDPEAEVTPDLRVRIYHDARVAEVMPESRMEGFRRHRPGPSIGTMAWRWEVNRFLNRWLRYCLGEGHSFVPVLGEPAAVRPIARRWSC